MIVGYLSKQATILALTPGRVYRKDLSPSLSVSSYLTVSPLPVINDLGCILSVALSLGFAVGH